MLNQAMLAIARDAALDYQLAAFATEQGDLESAQHFRELAAKAEQRLLRLTAYLAD